MPIWWSFLDSLLQSLSATLERGVLSKQECLQLATRFGYLLKDLEAALVFFDNVCIAHYYPSILPNTVFVDAQIPLDKITELSQHAIFLRNAEVKSRSTLSTGMTKAEWKRFRDEGIVTLGFLRFFKKHYVEGIFSPEDMLLIMKDLLVIAPIPLVESTTHQAEFFMPSLLTSIPPAELDKIRSSFTISPFAIYFRSGCIRSGVFCCLVVDVIKRLDWKVFLPSGKLICFAKNCIQLRIPKHPFTVALIDSFSYIEVYIDVPFPLRNEICPTIRNEILSSIKLSCKALHYNNDTPETGIFCPCKKSTGSKLHLADLSERKDYWICSQEARVYGKLSDEHRIWLDNSEGSGEPSSVTRDVTERTSDQLQYPGPSSPVVEPARKKMRMSDQHTSELSSVTVMEDVCKKTGVRDQQLDQEIPESDITRFAEKFPQLLSVHKALTINDLQRVYETLHESAPYWLNLGLALGLSHPVLNNIDTGKHRGDNLSCLREMLAELLSTQDVTWSLLSDALKNLTVKLVNLADRITAPLVDSDVQFSIPKLHQLHQYGINLMDVLSKDRYRFHITSGVQLLVKDRKKAPTLSPSDYVELIFNAWKRSKRPTYPPTWEGLLTILRKMDLGHLAEQIAKRVTGSLPEIEDSALPSESEIQPSKEQVRNKEQEVQLSPGDKEQATAGGESSMTELRSEVKRRLLEFLEAELDQLTDEYDEQVDMNHQLEKEIEHLRNENHHLRAESKGLVPVKQELKVEPGYQDVISHPHLPTEVLSQPQESIHSFDLPGVEVVASTCVIVTNSSQTFHWVGYGFKLTIPQGSLPAGVDQCRLEIKASVAGQYQFPDNLQLVSGVFWIHPLPLCQFQQQLTVEIQHCAKMTSSTKLSFVRAHCSQESLPYTFKQLEGRGLFTEHSPYGLLELNQFSGLAAAGENVERVYTASLYYLGSELHSREIHFVVNWDNEIHKTLVNEEYSSKRAILGVNHFVEFEEDSLTLDIPMAGAEVSGGWRITPMFHPTVIKKHVDQFKPGQRIPYCHLNAEMTNKRKKSAPKLFLQVKLVGAKDPYNIITINLDPQRTLPAARELLMQPQSHATHYPPSLGPPLHPLSRGLTVSEHVSTQTGISVHDDDQGDEDQLCIEGLQDIFSPLITAAKDWFELGLALGIKVDTLEGIKSKENYDKARLREMLTHWLRSSPSRTWSDICNGLRSDTVQQGVLADAIEEKYKGGTAWEHSSRLHPLTGEKREATEHTEQVPPKRPRSEEQ